MSEITVSDARAKLADVVDSARVGHDPVYLTRRGQRVAAVIDADDLDHLIAAAEDLADIQAAAMARGSWILASSRSPGIRSKPISAWHDSPHRGRPSRGPTAPQVGPRGSATDPGGH